MRKTLLIFLSLVAVLMLFSGCAKTQMTKDATPKSIPSETSQTSIDSGIAEASAEEEELSDEGMEDMDSTLADFENI